MRKITQNELLKVKKPIRYIGLEYNCYIKDSLNKIRICNAYSNIYETGIKDEKYNSIYFNLNRREDSYVERVFLPDLDLITLMQEKNIGLQSLETKDFVNEFDIIVFNINDVLEYVNVLHMLKLANIPIFSKFRLSNKNPLIIALGDAIDKNLAPISDFIDIFIVGQAEDVLNVLVDKYTEYKKQNLPKIEFLRILKNVQGIYIPKIHSNTLIYEAINSSNVLEDIFLVPNMYECFYKKSLKSSSINIISTSSKLRNFLELNEIKNEDLITFFTEAIKNNVDVIKLRFILGLPFENYEDLKSICYFLKKVIAIYNDIISASKLTFKLNFEFENFIIYPHTKFEWLKKNKSKNFLNKKEFIEKNIELNDNINLIFENAYLSELEQLLLFSYENISYDLEILLNNNFLYYNKERFYNTQSLQLLDIEKYESYLNAQDLNYKFPFDMLIIKGKEKLKLKNEYKKLKLNNDKGE